MPFTLAHIAVAPPLMRPLGRFAHPAALGIGCVAPDLAYALPGKVAHSRHGLEGLILYALPLGLAAFVIWHRCTLPGLLLLSPQYLRARLHSVGQSGKLTRASLPSILLCLLVGAAGHAFVDTFTHANSAGVQNLAFLQTALVEWQGKTLRLYKVLQHGGSLIGMTFLAWWCRRWLCRQTPGDIQGPIWAPRQQLRCLLLLLAIAGLVGLSSGAVMASAVEGDFMRFRVFVVRSIVYRSMTLALCISGLGFAAWQKVRAQAPSHAWNSDPA
jgi:hypothetical protein